MNSKGKEVQHGARLYSIAATRYGDAYDGNTTSLCVRRATYWDAEKGAEDPEKKGLCSNFLWAPHSVVCFPPCATLHAASLWYRVHARRSCAHVHTGAANASS